MFKPTFLYVKTHNDTGLKYFGKTSKLDPFKYKGSGKYWLRHLKKYGNNISTEIIGFYIDELKCKEDAKKFSITNNIVESKNWANLKIENGTDGGSDVGHNKSNTHNMRIASSLRNNKRVLEGTFHFQGEIGSIFAKNRNKILIEKGVHNFQGETGSQHSKKLNKKLVDNGIHNLLKRSDGTSVSSDRVKNGTHNFLQNTDTVSVVDRQGNCIRIPKDCFWNQIGPKENWEYVGITSKEAKNRLKTAKEKI